MGCWVNINEKWNELFFILANGCKEKKIENWKGSEYFPYPLYVLKKSHRLYFSLWIPSRQHSGKLKVGLRLTTDMQAASWFLFKKRKGERLQLSDHQHYETDICAESKGQRPRQTDNRWTEYFWTRAGAVHDVSPPAVSTWRTRSVLRPACRASRRVPSPSSGSLVARPFRAAPANAPSAPFIGRTACARGGHGGGTETLHQNTAADNKTHNTALSVATERSPQLRRWCVQGSNLCRCSGEFRTGTLPHPSWPHKDIPVRSERTSKQQQGPAAAAMLEASLVISGVLPPPPAVRNDQLRFKTHFKTIWSDTFLASCHTTVMVLLMLEYVLCFMVNFV